MKIPGILAAGLAGLLLANPVLASDDGRIQHVIRSGDPEQERAITVDLPSSYEDDTTHDHPVLYVLDGESNLDHAVAVADFLSESMMAPEMIVVGVHAGTTRARDYLPSNQEGSPGADQFLDFLQDELLPFVEEHYAAAPLRLISGHSYGGVLVTHALSRRPALFRAYLAQSPYLDEATAAPVVAELEKGLRRTDPQGVFYFANLGDEPELAAGFETLGAALEGVETEGLTFRTTREAGARHMSTRLVGLHDGLVWFFHDRWPLPDAVLSGGGADALARHLTELDQEFGYAVRYSEGAFQQATQGLLNSRDVAGAARAGALYVEHHPSSPVAHFLRGVALASGGRGTEGIAAIEKAIELYESEPDPSLKPLHENMQRVLRQLRGG